MLPNCTQYQALVVPDLATCDACLIEMLVRVCELVRGTSGLQQVAMSGGVFQNRLLLEQTTALLEGRGFTTLINRLVPPNDGGLSLGQAAAAARNFAQR
jgi:hydrogenase maturation protein HypF